MSIRCYVSLIPLLLFSMSVDAQAIWLVEPDAQLGNTRTVEVIDARPNWQKQTKRSLSLLRTACDFAITRWGDADSTPSRAQAVAIGLGKYLDAPSTGREFKLRWFTLHTNRRAPPSEGYDPKEPGVVHGVLHGMECRKGAEMVGGVGPNEVSPPLPLVVDIVVEVDGQEFAGRAVSSVPDVTAASAGLVDNAMQRLAESINRNVPTATPCQRLQEAADAAPKDRFYQKSIKRYCGE